MLMNKTNGDVNQQQEQELQGRERRQQYKTLTHLWVGPLQGNKLSRDACGGDPSVRIMHSSSCVCSHWVRGLGGAPAPTSFLSPCRLLARLWSPPQPWPPVAPQAQGVWFTQTTTSSGREKQAQGRSSCWQNFLPVSTQVLNTDTG